ncbi:MAG: 3-isopropylmalate dehydratase large subunit [Alphaproteobacteria bacterium]|nr:3-isopropylmalate dehydratase large subunit [Alphaproteobacteria bacterium]
MASPQTMFEKIWQRHVVVERDDGQCLLYVDRHLSHDGSFHAFSALREGNLTVRRPQQTFATPDHYSPTDVRTIEGIENVELREKVETLAVNARDFGVPHFGIDDDRMGIVHVIGPELGITQPGILLVCGDSHTSTHGAMGAIACGIGASEVAHVLATQTLWQSKPKTQRITVDGELGFGVTGKDVILAIIGQISAAGGAGYAIEYAGSVIRDLSIEGRLTVSNMSIEAGARVGMIAPDDKTFAYLEGRPYAPKGAAWDKAVKYWRTLPTDDGAQFDREVRVDGTAIAPMVTWGNSPENVVQVTDTVPDPENEANPERRESLRRAIDYMALTPGTPMTKVKVDRVFIGSCTNSRIEDLRQAAELVKGRTAVIPAMVSPGSMQVKKAAEAEGLDKVFTDAGFDWRHSACSMCVGLNGDSVAADERTASTSNRNFKGRQGPGSRTHLVSPVMAAAAAVTGTFTDVRRLMEEK